MNTAEHDLEVLTQAFFQNRPDDESTFWAYKAVLDPWLAAGGLVHTVRGLLAAVISTPERPFKKSAKSSDIMLVRIPECRVLLHLMPPLDLNAPIESSVTHRLLFNVGAVAATLVQYQSQGSESAMPGVNKRMLQASSLQLQPHEGAAVCAGQQAVHVGVPGAASVWLAAYSKPLFPYRARYDSGTGERLEVMSAELRSNRLLQAMQILSVLEDTQAAEQLETLAHDKVHFVRWEALKTLYKLDTQRGQAALKHASESDGHPHVRNAARQALDKIAGG